MFCHSLSRFRHNAIFLVGLLSGITLSLILASVTQRQCLSRHNLDDYVDDYEPRLNLAGKPIKAKKDPQPFTRPRYFSTELGTREKLFVGVISTQSTIKTRGVAVNKTVNHLVDKLMFFIDAPGLHKLNISIPGIVGFTDSRKNLKPFHVLKYIGDNFLDDFDFYFIITDSSYINAFELNKLVQGVSVRELVHAGGAKEGGNFCSLESGVLLSNSALSKVHAKLDWCIKNAATSDDSINLGQCILHATSIPCQDSIQGLEMKTLKLQGSWGLPVEQFNYYSVYPIHDASIIYTFHKYFCKRRLGQLEDEIKSLRYQILNTSYVAPGGRDSIEWPVGATPANQPATRFDVLRWDYFTMSHIYPESDFSNLKQLTRPDKEDIEFVLSSTLEWVKKRYGGILDFVHLINGYRRFDPSRGMDYRLDLAFKNSLTGQQIIKRMEVCKPLGRTEVVPFPYVTESMRANIVVLVQAGDRDIVTKFLRQYSSVLMEKQEKTYLLLVLMYDPNVPGKGNKDDAFLEIKKTAVNLSNRHKRNGGKIAWLSVKLPVQQSHVYHSLFDFGAIDLALRKLPADGLVFLCTPNIELRQDLINRVRMNTIRGMQIFSPIPFQEYNPDIVYNADLPKPELLDINKNYGHYDTMNTELISFYATDYIAAREKTKDKLPVVNSDKDIANFLPLMSAPTSASNSSAFLENLVENKVYSLFVRASDVHVLRAVEPSLRLRYRIAPACNQTLTNFRFCSESQAQNLGSRSALARLLLEYQASRQV